MIKAYMVIPSLVLVVNEGCPKTPSRVDACPSDGDGGQVNQKHSKPNWQWSQDLNIKLNCVVIKIAAINN
jgi:hypothetical protein